MRAPTILRVGLAAAIGGLWVPGGAGRILDAVPAANAGEAGTAAPPAPSDAKRQGSLAELPSKPGPHIEKIKALGDGQWLDLGSPAADPKWGRAHGASWGGHALVPAPDLRGAFRAGEGVHGGCRGNGRGLDDYWFYDISQHRWICLYPGTDTVGFNDAVKSGALSVDKLGRVVDKTGQPIPCHLMIHAWGILVYDTDLKLFFSSGGFGYGDYFFPGGAKGLARVKEGLDELKRQGFGKGPKGIPMGRMEYDPRTGRFSWEPTKNGQPSVGGFPRHLYVPSKKEHFVGGSGGVAFYNASTRTWRRVASPGQGPSGYDFIGCLDTKRNRAYVGNGGGNFFCFDMAAEKWSKVADTKGRAFGNTNTASATYDSAADAVLVWSFGKTRNIYALNPETNEWGEELPFDGGPAGRMKATNAAFFDPELGVHFVFSAGDSRDDGTMWVYRHRRAKGPGTGETSR